jgi:undecaprenyl diphosphate synthase
MDGNGRWAEARHLARIEGHRAGSESVDHVISAASELGIEALTLFAFSTENWKRSVDEVNLLMAMLLDALDEKLPKLQENNVRFYVIGQRDKLPSAIQERILRNENLTRNNTGLNLVLALSYGGRSEIVDAAIRVAELAKGGLIDPAELDEEQFRKYLYLPNIPDPDLLIRTSGEMRISNFLLWQCAYSEIYITETLWPDFRKSDLVKAIDAYKLRERRFGRTESFR